MFVKSPRMPYLNTGTVRRGGRVARSLPRLPFANAVESRKTKGIVPRAVTPPTRHRRRRDEPPDCRAERWSPQTRDTTKNLTLYRRGEHRTAVTIHATRLPLHANVRACLAEWRG